jgi:O-antigen/teichoic acid export membrane protein
MLVDGLQRRSFVVRYLTLFGGEVFSKGCVFVAFAYLARVLGPRDFGIVELALSVTVFFVLGTESGLGSYGARIIERTPERAAQLVPRVIVLRAVLGIVGYGLILAVSTRYGLPGLGILAIYGLIVLFTPFFTSWVFQGVRQMQWVACGNALRYATFSALVLLLVRPGVDTRLVAVAEVVGAAALVVFNVVLMLRVLRVRLDWRGVWKGAVDLFKDAWFLGASDLSWAAMWYAPTLIVGWVAIARTEYVAWVAAPVRIVMALHAFVWLYFFNLIPNLSRELHESVESWRSLVHRSLATSLWPPCLVALGGMLLAPVIVTTIYGDQYRQAVLPFQIVIWMLPVAWISGHFRFSLIAAGHQHLEFAASAAGAVTSLVLAFAGNWWWGVPGAAAALLVGGAVNTLVAGIAMWQVVGSVRLAIAVPPVLTCIGAAVGGTLVSALIDPTVGAALACLAYAGIAASQWDVRQLRDAWEGRLEIAADTGIMRGRRKRPARSISFNLMTALDTGGVARTDSTASAGIRGHVADEFPQRPEQLKQ